MSDTARAAAEQIVSFIYSRVDREGNLEEWDHDECVRYVMHALQQARAEERERCARIAAEHFDEDGCLCADTIAHAIHEVQS